MLSDFLEDEKRYNFIVGDNTRKELLYKNIYNIGISCIENNMENALRNVSNRLGGFILVFIMTLFTTVGTYCCREAKYRGYLNKILDVLKEEEYGRIKTAIELRTKENNMWDKLFERQTQLLTQKFLRELNEKVRINKTKV